MNRDDVLFLDIYQSIRGDWNMDVDKRAKFMLKLLPLTTLPDKIKNELDKHLHDMIGAWQRKRGSTEPLMIGDRYNPKYVDFDGRSWARDCNNSYDDLMALPWFDKAYYEEWSWNNLGSLCI